MPSSPESGPGAPVLVVNAAESRAQIALARSGRLLDCVELDAPGRANEHMAPAAAGLLERLGLTVAGLGGVACVRGPGSFTGLRMALAFGLGLARGAGLPMAGLDYPPLLAAGPAARDDGRSGGLTAVWVRSRSGQVYTQHFLAVAGTPVPTALDQPTALTATDAARLLARQSGSHPGPVFLLGSGAHAKGAAEALALAGPAGVQVLGERWSHPRPEVLARAASEAAYGPRPPEPRYLRPSDAEENLAAIARARGLDPAEAAERLARARIANTPQS